MRKLNLGLLIVGVLFNSSIALGADASRTIGVIYGDAQVTKQADKQVKEQNISNNALELKKVFRPTVIGGVR